MNLRDDNVPPIDNRSKYQKAAASEHDFEEEDQDFDESHSLDTSRGWRPALFCFLVTLILSFVTVLAIKGGITREKDAQYWPFADGTDDFVVGLTPKTLSRSKYGEVYTFDNLVRVDNTDAQDGESIYHYELKLGELKMNMSEGALALYRKKTWWMVPGFLHDRKSTAVPNETVFLLGKYDGMYRLVLPIILPDDGDEAGFTSVSLSGEPIGDAVWMSLSSETGGTVALYAGLSENPYELIADGVRTGVQLAASQKSKSFRTSWSTKHNDNGKLLHRLPEFSQRLGWCTWNAFYINLNGTAILDGVRWFQKEAGVPIGWMIIDDGWQHTTNDSVSELGLRHQERLASLGASPTKFSSSFLTQNASSNDSLSFREVVEKLKLSSDKGGMGLDSVFAWHAISGYWLGVDPDASQDFDVSDELRIPEGRIFYPHFSYGLVDNDPRALTYLSVSKGVGESDDTKSFYDKYYTYMTSVGLDGVKVDVQGITGNLKPFQGGEKPNYNHRHQVSTRLHQGLASVLPSHFNHQDGMTLPIIHCMCHAQEIFYQIPSLYGGERLPLLRASDDFSPKRPDSHGPMLAAVAFNSLLLGHVSTPDWDMFQTMLPDFDEAPGYEVARFHAMARSISGGPIYISDVPGATNASLINETVCYDGTVLSCSELGLPIRQSLLRDPFDPTYGFPIVIGNSNGVPLGEVSSGVFGIFSVVAESKTISIKPKENEAIRSKLEESLLLCVFHTSRKAQVLSNMDDSITVEVPLNRNLWSEIVTITPISNISDYEVAPLGINGKFNGGGAIVRKIIQGSKLDISVRGCGKFEILVRRRDRERPQQIDKGSFVARIEVDGESLSFVEADLDLIEDVQFLGLEEESFHLVTFELSPSITPEERWASVLFTV